jgi:nitroreductase
MDQFREKMKYGNYNAPAAIMVLGNLKLAQSHSSGKFWVQDCTAAVENILVAAAGMGLGTVWIGSYPKEDVMKEERDILGIPEDVIPLALIYVGYPAEDQPPRTQYRESRVHWQRY